MTFEFEELDYQDIPLGDISLRRRSEPRLEGKILYEVKLGDEFLMSSPFTEAEIQLARLGLAELESTDLDIVIGGLGLGYTAVTALENPPVRTLIVMEPVIDWHPQGPVPLGKKLVSDPRCNLVHADFFNVVSSSSIGFDRSDANRLVYAVLLRIDHSPSHWLNRGNSSSFTCRGCGILLKNSIPAEFSGCGPTIPRMPSSPVYSSPYSILLNRYFAISE